MTFAEQNPLPQDGALPEGDEIVEPTTDAPETVPAEEIDWSKRVEEWGGADEVADAVEIARALRDDDGVKALVTEGLRHMGYDPEAVFAAKAAGQPIPEPEGEPEDPDRLVTAAEVEARITAIRDEQAQAEQRAADSRAQRTVADTIESLSLADDEEARMVLSFAQKFASPDERDPQVLEAAIQAGHAAYIEHLEAATKRYVEARKEKNDGVPQPVTSGGSPSGDEAPPPKDLDDAKAQARAYLRNAEGV